MTGFFTIKETESKTRPGGKNLSCISCGAHKECITPRMKPYGEFKKKILIIGGSPERIDDDKGLPFQSRYGKLLASVLRKFDVDLFEDCLCMNASMCFVQNGFEDVRGPTNFVIECCRKSVVKVIEEHKPHIIILLGNSALFSVIGSRWKRDLGTIEKWRGWTIPDQDFKCWICPTYDPKEVLNAKNEVVRTIWEQDLERILKLSEESIRIYKEPKIKIIEDLSILSTIKRDSAFDYETTGLKPHGEGHKIVCCSIAVSEDLVYVFMMPKTREKRRPFIEYLANKELGKMAQNMKFEETWSTVRLKQPVQGWVWDTMLASHILDNRDGVSGLKFQTYVQFGIVDYDSEVAPFLKSTEEKNGNSHNRILKLIQTPAGIKKLLTYCAYDSIYEYRMAMWQRKLILDNELPF